MVSIDVLEKQELESAPIVRKLRNRPTVLVVDDEPAIADMLQMLLEDDYEVSTCLCPSQASELARQLQPDLLIVDFMMPNLNGIELLRQLRTQPDPLRVPAVLMTANSSLNYAGFADADIDALQVVILNKPFDNNRLLALLKELYN